jgi:hypothetical protein
MAGVMAMMAQVEHLEATEHCRIDLVDSNYISDGTMLHADRIVGIQGR